MYPNYNPLPTFPSSEIIEIVVYSLIATGLMIPIKIILSLLLDGNELHEKLTRTQIENSERRHAILKVIGIILAWLWIVACTTGTVYFLLNTLYIDVNKWAITFACSFGEEIILVGILKIFFKMILGLFFIRISKSSCIHTRCGSLFCKIVDAIIHCC